MIHKTATLGRAKLGRAKLGKGRLIAASGIALAGIVPAVMTSPNATATSAPVAAQCDGAPATLVATPGQQRITGTEAPDVIVARDADMVLGLGGDDIICSTRGVFIDAGMGDDRVFVTDARPHGNFILGPGSDEFQGSDAAERVFAGSRWTDGSDGADDVDIISTYGGDDLVHTGNWDSPNHDEIDLGDGDDRVEAAGSAGSGARIYAGEGRDKLLVEYPGHNQITIDLAKGSAQLGINTFAYLTGFGDLYLKAPRTRATILGTHGPNRLVLNAHDITVNARGRRDVLEVYGCGSVAHGAGGDDVLRSFARGCRNSKVRLFGDAGNDKLYGGPSPDILRGGSGRDFADGGPGRDRCTAEIERSCEHN